MTDILISIRSRLRDHIRTNLPAFRDVDLHYGRLTPEEVKKIVAVTPAARVGIFGSIKTETLPSGELKLSPRYAAVALVRTGDLLRSTDQAMQLASAMAGLISTWMPGIKLEDQDGHEIAPALYGVGLPEAITIEPSPAPVLENEGIALWGCLFSIPVVIGTSLSEQEYGHQVLIENISYPWVEDAEP